MRRVGWPIAVGDASPEVRRVAKTVTRALRRPGRGARSGRERPPAQRHLGRRARSATRRNEPDRGFHPRRCRGPCRECCGTRPRDRARGGAHRGGGGGGTRVANGARVLARGRAPRRLPRQGHRVGRRQVGTHRPQDRRDASPAPARPRCSCIRRTRCTATPDCSRPETLALFISKSGGSEELLALMPYLERHGIPAGQHRRGRRFRARRARAK